MVCEKNRQLAKLTLANRPIAQGEFELVPKHQALDVHKQKPSDIYMCD
jgi:hypothetical protein